MVAAAVTALAATAAVVTIAATTPNGYKRMYTVHAMKSITATEARKNWFRLLDEVVEGEVVLIEREGARVMLKLVEPGETRARIPDYRGLIGVPDTQEADQWGWEWDGSSEGLQPRRTGSEP